MKKKEFKWLLKNEKCMYFASKKEYLKSFLSYSEKYFIWKFQYNLRKAEFYYSKNGIISKVLFARHIRKKNIYGNKMNLIIGVNTVNWGMRICHGNVVINYNAKIGKDSIFHGNNCIGNNGKNNNAPIIHDKVNFGYGAVVIGEIEIFDNVIIGANAIVTKSFQANSVIAGNSTKLLHHIS